MSSSNPYSITTDVKYAPLELIDIPGIVQNCEQTWFNQTLSQVNDSVVRLGIIRGDFHWHKHDEEDELFYVVDGQLFIDVKRDAGPDTGPDRGEDGESQTVELGPKQCFMVPKQVVHRTRAPKGAVILMVEGAGVVPTGD